MHVKQISHFTCDLWCVAIYLWCASWMIWVKGVILNTSGEALNTEIFHKTISFRLRQPFQGYTVDSFSILKLSLCHCSPRMGNMRTLLRMKDKSGSWVTTCLTSGAKDCKGVAGVGPLLIPPPRICCTRGEGVGGLLTTRPLEPFSPPSLRNSCSRPDERDDLINIYIFF